MVTFWEVYQKAVKENGCNAGETFALSMFRAGAEWQLQQLGHPDPPGEQGADGTTIIKGVIKEKAIEAFNEAMIYFESPDCPTAEEALKHFIACLDQGLDSGCSVFRTTRYVEIVTLIVNVRWPAPNIMTLPARGLTIVY